MTEKKSYPYGEISLLLLDENNNVKYEICKENTWNKWASFNNKSGKGLYATIILSLKDDYIERPYSNLTNDAFRSFTRDPGTYFGMGIRLMKETNYTGYSGTYYWGTTLSASSNNVGTYDKISATLGAYPIGVGSWDAAGGDTAYRTTLFGSSYFGHLASLIRIPEFTMTATDQLIWTYKVYFSTTSVNTIY